ncbi:TVP38/TMEM64 family protein [Nocardia arizonensis]|uniref:TVP38/TMEM64 family protein n=1 Tax=Nocardia arizonensis TaxID=1141647 RepID=UPI0006D20D79|nr:TVP38/TMEM64 family protein [Nocardia arizonensis]
MTGNDGLDRAARRRHIARLTLCVVFLGVLFYLVAVARIVDVDEVRELVAATGPAAPVVYTMASATLGAALVPGPILAASSGLLFGPLVGTFVTLASSVGTAVISAYLGRRAGRDSARALLGADRAERVDAQLEQRGLWAVVGQRFVPGIPDAPASYVFGAFGIPLWQMAAGAFIGSAPRSFVYTALGASLDDLSAPLAYAALAVWCVMATIGAFTAHRGWRGWRRRGRSPEREAVPAESELGGTEPGGTEPRSPIGT